MAQTTIAVRGLRELNRAFARADRKLRLDWRRGQRQLAEPIRQLAASRALTEISRMPRSPGWGTMRIGVTQRVVYVAPKQRGVNSKTRRGFRRPNLAGLLLDRAMIPALERHQTTVLRDFDRLLARMGREWAR